MLTVLDILLGIMQRPDVSYNGLLHMLPTRPNRNTLAWYLDFLVKLKMVSKRRFPHWGTTHSECAFEVTEEGIRLILLIEHCMKLCYIGRR